MRRQASQHSGVTAVVFFPGNSLMHQVSSWGGENSHHDFEFCFPVSVDEIQAAIGERSVSIIDATEDPARAASTLMHAMAESEHGLAVVYTELMHRGLEMFARSRGALFLLGPLDNAAWKGLLETMTARIDRRLSDSVERFEQRSNDNRTPSRWQRTRRPNPPSGGYRKSA